MSALEVRHLVDEAATPLARVISRKLVSHAFPKTVVQLYFRNHAI